MMARTWRISWRGGGVPAMYPVYGVIKVAGHSEAAWLACSPMNSVRR
jgi:hypothetical protein